MNPSLFHQFEGMIWGAILGQILGIERINLEQNLTLPGGEREFERETLTYGSDLISLMNQTLADRRNPNSKAVKSADSPGKFSENLQRKITQLLPLILLSHEHLGKLQNVLENFCEKESITDMNGDIFLLGKAVAKVLHPTFIPSDLLPELIETPDLTQEYQEKLLTLKKLLKKKADLQQVIVELSQPGQKKQSSVEKREDWQRVFLLALYSFLSTPSDFRLSLMRGYQTGCHPSLIGGLTGVLSGGYNSSISIPVDGVFILANQVDLSDLKDLTKKVFSLWVGRGETPSQLFPVQWLVGVPHSFIDL